VFFCIFFIKKDKVRQTPRKGVSGEEIKNNLSDPESALIKTGEGYVQGYNGVTAADAANQIIICAKAIGSALKAAVFLRCWIC